MSGDPLTCLFLQFTTGVGINYQSNILVSKPPDQDFDEGMPIVEIDASAPRSLAESTLSLATACKPGTRFPSQQVVRQSDARPWQLHHKMPSDGRFRVIVFGGDIQDPAQLQRVNELGAWLRTRLLPTLPTITLSAVADPHGTTAKFITEREPSIIDVLLVHAAPRDKVELLRDLDEMYHPFDAKLGWDYDKVFVDGPSYHGGHGEAYQKCGVDEKTGTILVVRPDGYVGLVTTVDERGWEEIEKWVKSVVRTI